MISSLEISNFKSILHASVSLTGGNVFVGLNSAGKSSFIQALLLARQSVMTGSLIDGRVSLNGPLTNIGTGRDLLSEFAPDEVTSVQIDDIKIEIPYLAEESEPPVYLTGTFGEEPPFGDLIYLSTARVPPQVLYRRHQQYESASRMVGAQGEGAPGYLAAHGNSVLSGARINRSREIRGTLLEQVTYWMRRISHEVSLSLNELPQLDGLELRFEFDGERGVRTRPYRAGNVGFGLSHSLGIVLALVAAEAGSLVILEGPEAHLHPRAQRALGNLIGQAVGDGVQVIVETHSQQLVRGMCAAVSSGWMRRPDFTIHYCSRVESKTEVSRVQVDHDGRLAHIGGYDKVPDEFYSEFQDG